MNKPDAGPVIRPWEYLVWLAVTLPLLIVGALLWLFGLVLRLVVLFRRRKVNG